MTGIDYDGEGVAISHAEEQEAHDSMKANNKTPDIIWLQAGDEKDGPFYAGDCTWSQDKINDDDTQYIRKEISDEKQKYWRDMAVKSLGEASDSSLVIYELVEVLEEISIWNKHGNIIGLNTKLIPKIEKAVTKAIAKYREGEDD